MQLDERSCTQARIIATPQTSINPFRFVDVTQRKQPDNDLIQSYISSNYCLHVTTMSRLGPTLPLRLFIRRQQVLQLYRNMLRAAKRVDDVSVQDSLRQEIRNEFVNSKNLKDNAAIKTALVTGQRSLSRLEDMSTAPSSSKKATQSDSNSWINTADDTDVRGRVGTGWPWK